MSDLIRVPISGPKSVNGQQSISYKPAGDKEKSSTYTFLHDFSFLYYAAIVNDLHLAGSEFLRKGNTSHTVEVGLVPKLTANKSNPKRQESFVLVRNLVFSRKTAATAIAISLPFPFLFLLLFPFLSYCQYFFSPPPIRPQIEEIQDMARVIPVNPSNFNIIRVPKRITKDKKKGLKIDGEFKSGSVVEYFLVNEARKSRLTFCIDFGTKAYAKIVLISFHIFNLCKLSPIHIVL